jgi:hypothetical protein
MADMTLELAVEIRMDDEIGVAFEQVLKAYQRIETALSNFEVRLIKLESRTVQVEDRDDPVFQTIEARIRDRQVRLG